MAKRINIILPETLVKTIHRLARPGQRSRFIERAVQHYVNTASQEPLQERLKQAAIRDRDLDLEIASDWFAVDQEEWDRLEKQEQQQPQLAEKRGNLPHGARPGGRARNQKDQTGPDHPERHHYSATTMVAPITSTVRLPLSPLHVLLPADSSTGP